MSASFATRRPPACTGGGQQQASAQCEAADHGYLLAQHAGKVHCSWLGVQCARKAKGALSPRLSLCSYPAALSDTKDSASIHKDEVVAFMMFRFTWDDEDEPDYPVLYLYELQVVPRLAGQGLGKYLLHYATRLAEHFKMRKVVLTCLKNSTDAMAFYTRQGFGIDANSPSRGGFHNEVYEILSNKPDYR